MWIAVVVGGAWVCRAWHAWLVYQVKVLDPAKIRAFLEPLPEILENKYYLDTLYQDVFVKMFLLGGVAWALSLWDKYVVDGVVNGVGRATTLGVGADPRRAGRTGAALRERDALRDDRGDRRDSAGERELMRC